MCIYLHLYTDTCMCYILYHDDIFIYMISKLCLSCFYMISILHLYLYIYIFISALYQDTSVSYIKVDMYFPVLSIEGIFGCRCFSDSVWLKRVGGSKFEAHAMWPEFFKPNRRLPFGDVSYQPFTAHPVMVTQGMVCYWPLPDLQRDLCAIFAPQYGNMK